MGQPFQYVGERGDAGRAVVLGGVLGRGVRDAGGVAYEQHGGRDGAGEDPGVVSGTGAEDGHGEVGAGAEEAGDLVAQGVVELDDGGERLADDVQFDPVGVGVRAGRLLQGAGDGVEGGLVGGAGVEPAADEGGDGVDAVGFDGDLPEGGDGTGAGGLAAGGEDRLGVGLHGVAAVGEAGGAMRLASPRKS